MEGLEENRATAAAFRMFRDGELDRLIERQTEIPQKTETEVDIERQMEVDWAGAGLFRVQVNFPELTQRVGLDEMSFVVHMESAVDGLTLYIGDEPGNVDHCHGMDTTVRQRDPSQRPCRCPSRDERRCGDGGV